MCVDPMTMMVIGLTAASTFTEMKGANQETKAAVKADRLQAKQLDAQQDRMREANAREVAKERRNAQRLIGKQVANYSSNGIVIDGSAMDVINDSAQEADLDIEAIRSAGQTERQNLAFEAGQLRTRAKNTKKAGKLNSIAIPLRNATRLVGAF